MKFVLKFHDRLFRLRQDIGVAILFFRAARYFDKKYPEKTYLDKLEFICSAIQAETTNVRLALVLKQKRP